MTQQSRRKMFTTAAVAATGLAAAAAPMAARAAAADKLKAVFQVSDADAGKWNLTLNNVRNVKNEMLDDGAELEIVAFGPGIGLLKAGSPLADRITEARKDGITIVACENSMKAQKLVYADMLSNIGFVPAGVVELIKKQRDGWAYIRP